MDKHFRLRISLPRWLLLCRWWVWQSRFVQKRTGRGQNCFLAIVCPSSLTAEQELTEWNPKKRSVRMHTSDIRPLRTHGKWGFQQERCDCRHTSQNCSGETHFTLTSANSTNAAFSAYCICDAMLLLTFVWSVFQLACRSRTSNFAPHDWHKDLSYTN